MSFDIISYKMGQQAGGGGANLEVKTGVKIITNGAFFISPSSGYDGMSSVSGIVNVPEWEPDMTVTAKQFKMLIDYNNYYGPLQINFGQTVASDCTIDWGDGTTETSENSTQNMSGGNPLASHTPYSHQYQKNQLYVVSVTAHSGDLFVAGHSFTSGSLLLQPPCTIDAGNIGRDPFRVYHAMLREVAFGEDVITLTNTLKNCFGVKTNRTCGCVTDGEVKAFCPNCGILNDVVIPDGVTSLSENCFHNTLTKRFVFPASIRTIKNNALYECYSTVEYDFTAIDLVDGTFPVTLANTNSITCRTVAPLTSILFKSKEVADAAKAATNWANYASYIHYVGEEST